MNEFIARQMSILPHAIAEYRDGRIDLNTLVQRIEGVSSVVELDSWKEDVFPIIVELEQINAITLDTKTELTSEGQVLVEASLRRLESLIQNS